MIPLYSMSSSPSISPLLRLRSAYHRCWFECSQRIKWFHRQYHEQPARTLPDTLTAKQQHRIEGLQVKYGIQFEDQFNSSTALDNYGYLDLLDQSKEKVDWQPGRDQEMVDIGSLNFYYAPALHAYFHPRHLMGIELDGYRIYTNFYSRFDYAQYYIRSFANTSYRVMDFCDFTGSADRITCFYPFVKPGPLVSWRLPLKVFQPQRLFKHIARSLRRRGCILMVNHGEEETRLACDLAHNCGLRLLGQPQPISPLFPRTAVPIVSILVKP